jgi:hypothetical protein
MDKIKESNNERPRERINQFIIECMFSKYFEEKTAEDAVVSKEEIATSA